MKKSTLRNIISIMAAVVLALCTAGWAAAESLPGSEPCYSADDLFTDRDLEQSADLSGAETLTVSDGNDIHITRAGVYVLAGTASGATVYVEADSDDKVQLVLDGLNITNADFPCIYILSADKVFVTVAADSSLSVTGSFRKDGNTKTDGVIFSKQDLVLNGTASLVVSSTDNGIVCKDDLKVTGGTWTVTASSKAIEANDSIRIAGGTFVLAAGTDAIHAENDDDDTKGFVYIGSGTFTLKASDDGIHATSVIQVDGGTVSITAKEGLEATVIQINGGTVNITSTDDGINAARKSSAYTPAAIFNGGEVNITMGQGDTDGIDSNGNIYMNGGIVSVNGNSTFDYDGVAEYNGGTIYLNGQASATIPNQLMGGGGGRGQQGGFGQPGEWGQQGGRGQQGGWGPNGGQDNGGWGGRGGRR